LVIQGLNFNNNFISESSVRLLCCSCCNPCNWDGR
jgi:hypothetical protein